MQVIYAKSGEIAKECEALILLAEVICATPLFDTVYYYHAQVSIENSNFNQAVEDLLECLAKRIKSLPSDSRFSD